MNRQITLASRPDQMPTAGCWKLVETEMPHVQTGEILVRVIYVSIDPAMRGWINEGKSYIAPVQIGETMRALAVGQVVESGSDDYQSGDYVSGMFGVQEFALVTVDRTVAKVDPSMVPLASYLGVLGMPGMTAYFGLLDVGQPKASETVLISGAAGAVGALVGQIARIKGCRVVGVAGGSKKCDYLKNHLGFDAVIDYKAEQNLSAAVGAACPDGVDIFFDNVGGDILDVALDHLAHRARIVICGAISQYNNGDRMSASIDYMPVLFNSAKVEGFVILDYVERYGEAVDQMGKWLQQNRLVAHEDIREGIESFGNVLLELFSGSNFGKLILQVGETGEVDFDHVDAAEGYDF